MKANNLTFYEIYPATFYDSDKDGIGDIAGIIAKLDYVKALGFKGIWFNPFFASPFLDGGYDISDYKKIDSRFGDNQAAYKLIAECHKRGLLVMFDLVAGHMSWEAACFKESAKPAKNDCSDMFVWNDSPWESSEGYSLIRGLYPRHGAYLVNFYVHQPALNFGFNQPQESWQEGYDGKGPQKVRKFIESVMEFWCDKGVDGFRCDMADSLVKNDGETKELTQKTWREMFGNVRKKYPNLIAVSEWSNPSQALNAGFDMDFVLDHESNFSFAFFRAGSEGKNRNQQPLLNHFDQALYDKAVKDLLWRIECAKKHPGCWLAPISGNHDTFRIADALTGDALKAAYVLIYTLPGIPFVFAGDELGQSTDKDYPSKDGGYQRTGARFAMNWDESLKNNGFSATEGELYLPVQTKNQSVKRAQQDAASLLNLIKKLNEIRTENPDLQVNDNFELLDKAMVFKRGKTVVALNLKDEPLELEVKPGNILLSIGDVAVVNDKQITVGKRSSVIYQES